MAIHEQLLLCFSVAADSVSNVKVVNNPYKLLTEELIREAIQNDIQKEFTLESYEVKDFTNPGDNYSRAVTSVKVKKHLSM